MKRLTAAAAIAVILVGGAVGCSKSDDSATTTTQAQAQSGGNSGGNSNNNSGPSSTLDVMKCADVALANLGLATGSDVQKNAGTLKEYNPPANVSSDIDYLASSNGVQLSDTKTAEASTNVTAWVDALCPSSSSN